MPFLLPCARLLALALASLLVAHSATAAQAGLALSSEAKGNIFTADEGALALRLPAAGVGAGSVTIHDETGAVVATHPIPATAPAASSAPATVAIPLPGKGHYRVVARATGADGAKLEAATHAAVVGPLLDDSVRMQSRLGLWTVQGDPDLVVAAGARWNRRMTSIHTLDEAILSPNPPPADRVLFPDSPFTQVGVLSFGLPLWMMEPITHKKSYGNPLTVPKDWGQLRRLVAAWARQQEKFPPYFEIYNEPEWQWKGANEDLVRFLATVADGIREAHPATKIYGPGFSSIRIKDPARLDLATSEKLGLLDHLDGIVVHAYVDGTPPEGEFIRRVVELQTWLKEIGRPDFPVHLTEFGWTSGTGTWQKPVDELTQARYVVRSLTLLAAVGIENSTYFCLQYKAAPNPGERGFSLVHDDQTPKPAYAAYSAVARWLAGVEGLGTRLHLTPTTHLILFNKTDGTTIAVAWDTQAERVLELPLETSRRENFVGRALADSPGLTLSPSPVFLEFRGQQSPEIEMLPAVEVMRGGDPLALPRGEGWIAPAPLHMETRNLVVPGDAPNGDYLLLSRADGKWLGQPVKVIPPLEAAAPVLKWPADAPAPHLEMSVVSHAATPLTTRVAVALEGSRDRFVELPAVRPGEKRSFAVPLPGLEPGRRHQGKLTIDSRHGGRRDLVSKPLDITLLAAAPLPRGATRPDWSRIPAVDFSAWDPFGGPIAPEDCSATLQSAHDSAGLHLRVVVRDDEHVQSQAPEQMWSHDAIQIGLDADYEKSWEANDLFGLKGHRVFEYGIGWNFAAKDPALTWRWISYTPELPVGVAEPRIRLNVTRKGDETIYEALFPWAVLGLDRAPAPGTAIGIALSVSDADTGKKGRRALRLFNGVSEGKDPEKFGPLWLR